MIFKGFKRETVHCIDNDFFCQYTQRVMSLTATLFNILGCVMDIDKIRKDFPIFHRPLPAALSASKQGRFLVYLDNAATAQKPHSVIDTITQFYSTSYATVHRALYELGEMATMQYEAARDKVAAFINAGRSAEIVFTKGTTEGINFIAQAWALPHLRPGDEIVLTYAEHHANLVPWQRVAEKTGAKLVFIPIDRSTYKVGSWDKLIGPKTKLVAVTYSSNIIGNIWRTDELEKLITHAHSVGALVLIDAAQAVAHKKIDVQRMKADFLVFSGHKMFGPTGIGVLYINYNHVNDVEPYQTGGSMISEVSFNRATWAPSPQKFEAGTPPIAGAIGLGAAVEYMNETINFDQLLKHEASLCATLIDGLQHISGIKVVGNLTLLKEEGHLVSIAFDEVHPHDVATLLGYRGVATRAGHMCAQPLVHYLGIESILRVSFAAYNTQQDVEIFLKDLHDSLHTLAQKTGI